VPIAPAPKDKQTALTEHQRDVMQQKRSGILAYFIVICAYYFVAFGMVADFLERWDS